MKTKYFILSFTLVLLLTTIGCSKFLDKEPVSTYVEEEYYKNTDQVETGVIGCYAAVRPLYNLDYILAGLRSDDAYISEAEGDINQIDGFGETTTNSYVSSYWQTAYFAIKQCNTVLKYLDSVTDPIKKNYFEGEAKFLRAHMYFNLVRLYGDVPLVTKSVAYNDVSSYVRINKDTVYNQIIADFKVAIQKLPASWTTAEIARATNYAAKGMLAKVYLTQKDYANAKILLLDLLQNPGQYQLLPGYKSIFGNNEMNAEILYAVRFRGNSNGLGNTFTYNTDRQSGSVGFRAASDFRGNTPFPAADSIRKSQTFILYTGVNSTGGLSTSYYCGGKFLDPGSVRNDGGADFIVLRYADVILMYAETENEINGGVPLVASDTSNPQSRLYQLNRIRIRAGGAFPKAVPAYTYNSTTINTQDKFRIAIKAERRKEFGEEDQRWYDLLRWGDAVTVMNAHFSSRSINTTILPYQTLFPIPQREIDVSGGIIKQNPGYH